MYYLDKRLQYPVRVETPDPLFARQLQQAIGGIEGEIRVCMQYFFQAWGARGPSTKYRDMLLHTATEELGHIEMLGHRGRAEPGDRACIVAGDRSRGASAGQRGDGRRRAAAPHGGRHAAAPPAVDRHGRLSRQQRRRGIRHVAHLRQRQPGRRHVLQCRSRKHRPRAGLPPLQCSRGCRHEGHAVVHDRARHHAPTAMARGDRGNRRPHRRTADPQLVRPIIGEGPRSPTPSSRVRPMARRPRPAATRRARRWTAKGRSPPGRTCRSARKPVLGPARPDSAAQVEQMAARPAPPPDDREARQTTGMKRARCVIRSGPFDSGRAGMRRRVAGGETLGDRLVVSILLALQLGVRQVPKVVG